MNQTRPDTQGPRRRIRSFVRREGRLTPGQQRALEQLWPQFGLACAAPLNFADVFGRAAPVTLEIGFGNGASLAQMAAQDPASDFIGIEVHRPGVGRLLMELERRKVGNVRVFCHDAVDVLEQSIPDAALDRVLLFFPDPWHKKRHHKRRIVQPAFLDLVAQALRPGGFFHAATDWENYAEHIRDTIRNHPALANASENDFIERPAHRPVTKFEQRGHRLGHGVWDIMAIKA